MSKAGLWKNIFGQREKVVVDVGGTPHELTHTQKFRFEELRESQRQLRASSYLNPLDDSRYSLDGAAFRLMLDPTEILEKAVAGRYRIYVDASGVTGTWRRREPDGTVSQSGVVKIQSGHDAPVALQLDVPQRTDFGNTAAAIQRAAYCREAADDI